MIQVLRALPKDEEVGGVDRRRMQKNAEIGAGTSQSVSSDGLVQDDSKELPEDQVVERKADNDMFELSSQLQVRARPTAEDGSGAELGLIQGSADTSAAALKNVRSDGHIPNDSKLQESADTNVDSSENVSSDGHIHEDSKFQESAKASAEVPESVSSDGSIQDVSKTLTDRASAEHNADSGATQFISETHPLPTRKDNVGADSGPLQGSAKASARPPEKDHGGADVVETPDLLVTGEPPEGKRLSVTLEMQLGSHVGTLPSDQLAERQHAGVMTQLSSGVGAPVDKNATTDVAADNAPAAHGAPRAQEIAVTAPPLPTEDIAAEAPPQTEQVAAKERQPHRRAQSAGAYSLGQEARREVLKMFVEASDAVELTRWATTQLFQGAFTSSLLILGFVVLLLCCSGLAGVVAASKRALAWAGGEAMKAHGLRPTAQPRAHGDAFLFRAGRSMMCDTGS